MKIEKFLVFFIMVFYSCDKPYKIINDEDFTKLSIQKKLIKNSKYSVYIAGDSVSDPYPNLLVKSNKLYLFDNDCELVNDSIIHYNNLEFIIDEYSDYRKEGIWVYTDFYTEGNFIFKTNGMKFNSDSIPRNWKGKLPKQEGIYYFENNKLKLISKVQSEEEFKKNGKDGFYYIPNNGKLFKKINLAKLD